MAIDKYLYTAYWLENEGVQGTTLGSILTPESKRTGNSIDGFRETTARRGGKFKGVIPFTIHVLDSNEVNQAVLTNSRSMTLLINPNDLNYGSSQLLGSQYTRGGHVNSLWGSNQPTLLSNGSSAAFITDAQGLTDADPRRDGVSRRDSIAYANLMSLVTLIRNNGYNHLKSNTSSSSYKNPVSLKEDPGANEVSGNLGQSEGLPTNNPLIERGVAFPSSFLGQSRNRVIHVLDTLAVSYGGTTYLGSFNAFTLEVDAHNPYRFGYSFEFVVSGLLGDHIQGHLNNGSNKNTGIIVNRQGTSFAKVSIGMDESKLKFINEDLSKNVEASYSEKESNGIPSFEDRIRSLSRIEYSKEEEAIRERLLSLIVPKKGPSGARGVSHLRNEILLVIPIVDRIYSRFASGGSPSWYPAVLTSAVEGTHSSRSKHYTGFAVDFRANNIYDPTGKQTNSRFKTQMFEALEKEIKQELGGSYTVLLEYRDTQKEHFHIQYNG